MQRSRSLKRIQHQYYGTGLDFPKQMLQKNSFVQILQRWDGNMMNLVNHLRREQLSQYADGQTVSIAATNKPEASRTKQTNFNEGV